MSDRVFKISISITVLALIVYVLFINYDNFKIADGTKLIESDGKSAVAVQVLADGEELWEYRGFITVYLQDDVLTVTGKRLDNKSDIYVKRTIATTETIHTGTLTKDETEEAIEGYIEWYDYEE